MVIHCRFCNSKTQLIRPKQIGHNRDIDGFFLYYCPVCFSVDNLQLLEERNLVCAQTMQRALFSNHTRREVVYLLASNNGHHFESNEQRKMFIADTIKKARNTTDEYACRTIAECFNLKVTKVLEVFFRIHRVKNRFSYEVSDKIL